MAKITVEENVIDGILKAIPYLIKLPVRKTWIDYDKEADVLYVSFKRPQKATDSQMLKNGILLRYKDNTLVGVTILNASKR